jgi:hypothetical protein
MAYATCIEHSVTLTGGYQIFWQYDGSIRAERSTFTSLCPESPATVRAFNAVGIHDDFAASKTGVAVYRR